LHGKVLHVDLLCCVVASGVRQRGSILVAPRGLPVALIGGALDE